MTRTFLSLEAELDILADNLEAWANDDQRAAVHSVSVEMRNFWSGRCEGWREAARYIRKIVDDSRPEPEDFS
jgi:hypothetical protein